MRLVVSLVALLLAATPTAAEPPEDTPAEKVARRHHHAIELHAAGKPREALAELTAAYDEMKLIWLLHDQAVCQEALHDRAAAVALYRRYLDEDLTAPDRAQIAARMIDLEAGKPLTPPESLRGGAVIESSPSGMLVKVDGKKLGRTPWIGFIEGRHELTLEVPGLKPEKISKSWKRGEVSSLYLAVSPPCICSLDVTANVEAADVYLNDAVEPAGQTPFHTPVVPREIVITVKKPGYVPRRIEHRTRSGEAGVVAVELQPEKAPLVAP